MKLRGIYRKRATFNSFSELIDEMLNQKDFRCTIQGSLELVETGKVPGYCMRPRGIYRKM